MVRFGVVERFLDFEAETLGGKSLIQFLNHSELSVLLGKVQIVSSTF